MDALNIQNKIPEISSVIDSDNDAYIVTTVFMPILAAGIKGNQRKAQLALYKGQLNAIRQVAIIYFAKLSFKISLSVVSQNAFGTVTIFCGSTGDLKNP